MKSAWLITWEWLGDHAKRDDNIVSILNYRISPSKIKDFMELLYISSEYTLSEKIAYAKNSKNNPYPAQAERGHITCGHNPFLHGRKVNNLRVKKDSNDNEYLEWEEVYLKNKFL